MRATIRRAESVKGEVKAPPSKSFTHRAFAISCLAEGKSSIREPLLAGDTMATLRGVEAFGGGVEESDGRVDIVGTGGTLSSPGFVDCQNSGTGLRLLTAIASLDGEVVLTGDESLQKRPMQPLLDALVQLGVRAESVRGDGRPPVRVLGRELAGGRVEIRGDVSSQFISSLLIAAPYALEGVEIALTSPPKSRPYLDITLAVMRDFGVEVENHGYRRFSLCPQVYSAGHYPIEGDYSSASYFVALAAMGKGKIKIGNLSLRSFQGDKRILDIAKEMGAGIREVHGGIEVEGTELRGIGVDLGDAPDLLPTVAAMAAGAEGRTVIHNVEHARYKETDRIKACASEISRLGARVRERKDGLEVWGSEELTGARVESHGDHRMVMALAVLGLTARGETVIEGAESATISYPGFFDSLEKVVSDGIRLEP